MGLESFVKMIKKKMLVLAGNFVFLESAGGGFHTKQERSCDCGSVPKPCEESTYRQHG